MVKSKSVTPARLAAFQILRRVEEGAYASVLLANPPTGLDPADRALSHELVLGVLRQQLFLDRLIEHYANRKVSDLDQPVTIALRLGLYQLRFLSRIPPSAAVNESVNLTRVARLRSAEGLVNAVLRRATREPEFDPLELISDSVERLSVETSHPRWLLERWIALHGISFTSELARSNNRLPPIAFRVVRNRASETEVVAQLQRSESKITSSKIVDGGWRIEATRDQLLSLMREGKVYLQDEASQLVATVVRPQPGEHILDLCAAPGSKTTLLSDIVEGQAIIIACDRHQSRLHMISATSRLQGLSGIDCLVADGLNQLPFEAPSFDAVLVDAPCSGTGTLRRNPEIRWRITPADLIDLPVRQGKLLENAANVLKPGGRLIYSTCSLEPEENEEVVESFLSRRSEFERIRSSMKAELVTGSGDIRTWPNVHGTDGFFIAVLRRRHR